MIQPARPGAPSRAFDPTRGLLLGWDSAQASPTSPPARQPPPASPPPANPPPGDRDTIVRMRDRDVFQKTDGPGPNHAYVELVDPKTGETWIARGGPDHDGMGFGGHFLSGDLYIKSQVTPEQLSKDAVEKNQGRPTNLIDSTIVRGVPFRDAVREAEDFSQDFNRQHYHYLPRQNSNSFAYSYYRDRTGRTPPIGEHWGARTELPRTRPPPDFSRPLDPDPTSGILTFPGY
jgi:hypothetical protein